jgi:hypothetical protein
MPTIALVHADGRFKVLKDGEQPMVPMSPARPSQSSSRHGKPQRSKRGSIG